MKTNFAVLILGCIVGVPTIADELALSLDVFAGEWAGEATAYFPRREDRDDRHEDVELHCEQVLKNTYVQCRSSWTTTDGRTRELLVFWNFDEESDRYQILYLYDNWPGKVNYELAYDAATRTLKGSDTFEGPGGVAAKERVEWTFAEDGQEIRSTEFNRYATDPEGYWAKSFEFVLRRVVHD